MRSVTVNKVDLRSTLIQNKDDHEADFAITFDKYKSALIERLYELADDVRDLKPGETAVWHDLLNLPAPENHAEDYQRAIEMLEWETGDEVVLDEREFKQFVQDDWLWKHQVQTANMLYAGSASPSKFNQ